MASGFMRLAIVLVFADGVHRAATDIVGIAIGCEFSVVQPADKVLHDVGVIDPSGPFDAIEQCQR